MVAVKGLSSFKTRVSGDRESRMTGTGGVRGLKVYKEDEEVKILGRDQVVAETKKSIPVKAATSHIQANCQKKALNKLEKVNGKNINSDHNKVGRKALVDISNSLVQKNETFGGSRLGKGKVEKTVYSQRVSVGTRTRIRSSTSGKHPEVFNGNAKAKLQGRESIGDLTRKTTRPQRQSFPVPKQVDKAEVFNGNGKKKLQGRESIGGFTRKTARNYCAPQRKSFPVPKQVDKAEVFNGNAKTKLQGRESNDDLTRKTARNYCPPQRKSFPVPKQVDKTDKRDLKRRNLENKVKNKEKHVFSVKSKVVTTVVPQVSNAGDYRWKNRVSDGFIKMVSEGQPKVDTKRLSRISMKPTVKTIAIPKAQRASRTTSITKPKSAISVLSKKKETTLRSESSSCEQLPESASASNSNLDASTSKVTAKRKSGRRKSYTSLLIESSKLIKDRCDITKDRCDITKEEILPNIDDDSNQLEVAEYIDEIYQHYWVTEAHNPSLKNYMEIQTDITPQMRGVLINWLIEVHLKFDLMHETLYLMVTLLDYYLSVINIKKNEMQLVGLTSLLLASKYEDYWHPKVMELLNVSGEIYTREQMLGMETTILQQLNFRLNLPTPYVFMLRFLKAAQGGKKLENLAFFLIELCLVEYDALDFKPSLLCASAIYVARCTLHMAPAWTPLLRKHSHYEEVQIRNCAEMILRFHKAATKAVLRVTYDKYMDSGNYKVASIKPLDRLPSP